MQADERQRKQAEHIRKKDEHEQREDIGQVLAPGRADIGAQQIVDKAGEAFDRHLPAPRNLRLLRPAADEDDQHRSGDRHPQRRIGESDVVASQRQVIGAEQRLDRELVNRIDLAFRHFA